ncbi:MAG: TetR/AcrR family transcriptional regulator [Actinomycetia bacterium]|nr:TetR/AcrR family transcriptional regulator [Actinomycetes bacterium]
MTTSSTEPSGVRGGTRQRILDAARVLFSKGGYLSVSMNDIAKYVGITKAAIYHYFEGKDAIHEAVLDDVLSRLRAQVADALAQETAEGRLRRFIRNYLQFGMLENNLVNTIVAEFPPDGSAIRQRVTHFREELADQVQPIIEQNLSDETFKRAGDGRFVTSLFMSMMDGLLLECSLFNRATDTARVADYVVGALNPGNSTNKTGATSCKTPC